MPASSVGESHTRQQSSRVRGSHHARTCVARERRKKLFTTARRRAAPLDSRHALASSAISVGAREAPRVTSARESATAVSVARTMPTLRTSQCATRRWRYLVARHRRERFRVRRRRTFSRVTIFKKTITVALIHHKPKADSVLHTLSPESREQTSRQLSTIKSLLIIIKNI